MLIPPRGAFRFSPPVMIAAVFAVAGVVWRIWLTAVGAPQTNSDEAIIGLAALHIAQCRELPVFFYGQHYMGTIEAYLAAPLAALPGPPSPPGEYPRWPATHCSWC